MARSLPPRASGDSTEFRVKWFVGDEKKPPVSVCLQGHSGPCPLLALANALLLRRTLVMPENVHAISKELLLGLLIHLSTATDTEILDVLPRLASSVAVDVCFSGTTDFVPSPELAMFQRFGIRVLHGWIPDPHDEVISACISPLSYNQVCDQLVFAVSSPISELTTGVAPDTTPIIHEHPVNPLSGTHGSPSERDNELASALISQSPVLLTDTSPAGIPDTRHPTYHKPVASAVMHERPPASQHMQYEPSSQDIYAASGTPAGTDPRASSHAYTSTPADARHRTTNPTIVRDEGTQSYSSTISAEAVGRPDSEQLPSAYTPSAPPMPYTQTSQDPEAMYCADHGLLDDDHLPGTSHPHPVYHTSDLSQGQLTVLSVTKGSPDQTTGPSRVDGSEQRYVSQASMHAGEAGYADAESLNPYFSSPSPSTGNDEGEQSISSSMALRAEELPTVGGNALLIQAFLQETAAMLTHFGLTALHETVYEGEYAVLFINNHFSVVTKHDYHLYMLVTDAGYAGQPSIIWERLSDVDGNTTFYNALFRPASVRTDSATDRKNSPGSGASSSTNASASAAQSAGRPRPTIPQMGPTPARPQSSNAIPFAKRNGHRKGEKGGKGCVIQ